MAKLSKTTADTGFGAVGIIALIAAFVGLVVIFTLFKGSTGGTLKLNNGCKDTNLALAPVSLKDLKDPVSLQATVTMGSTPVANEHVTFRSFGHDKNGHDIGNTIGMATTNSAGVASFKSSAGIADQSITYGVGGTVQGIKAEFDGNGVSDRTKDPNIPFYCGSNASVNLAQPILIQKVEI